jgi:hypothetical protein
MRRGKGGREDEGTGWRVLALAVPLSLCPTVPFAIQETRDDSGRYRRSGRRIIIA